MSSPSPSQSQPPRPISPLSPAGRHVRAWSGWLLLALLLLLVYRVDPEQSRAYPVCPTYGLFGLHCPVCGSTRALHALLHGDLAGSLRKNMLLLPGLAGLLLLCRKPQVRWQPPLLWAGVAVMILYGILRNLPFYPLNLLAPH